MQFAVPSEDKPLHARVYWSRTKSYPGPPYGKEKDGEAHQGPAPGMRGLPHVSEDSVSRPQRSQCNAGGQYCG